MIAQQCKILDSTLEDVMSWLVRQSKQWLLIIDNADDAKIDYSKYFPPCNHGNVIITTRIPELEEDYESVGHASLDLLQTPDARDLLFKSAGISKIHHMEQQSVANKVLDLLGKHTLAITQAGAVVRSMKAHSLDVYPPIFEKQRKRLLQSSSKQRVSRYGNVYATFEVSVDYLAQMSEQEDLDALQLLQILPYLHSGISERLFEEAAIHAANIQETGEVASHKNLYLPLTCEHAKRLPEWMLRADRVNVDEIHSSRGRRACLRLASLSLITIREHAVFLQFSLHPLVNAWVSKLISCS